MSKHALLVPAAFALVLMTGCGEAPKPILPGETAQPSAPKATTAPEPAPAPVEVKKPDAPVATAEPKGATAAPKEELKPAPAGAGDAQAITWGRATKYTMMTPPTWKQQPSSGMRQLQLSIPKVGADTDDAEIVGFVFPSGGGADANIQRWVAQMGGEGSLKNRKNMKTTAGADAILAELEGSYSAMSPTDGSPLPSKSNYKMLGAFIPSAGGEVYLKLTGPKETVDAQKAAFEKMVESFK
jgi:hypothetical protein